MKEPTDRWGREDLPSAEGRDSERLDNDEDNVEEHDEKEHHEGERRVTSERQAGRWEEQGGGGRRGERAD